LHALAGHEVERLAAWTLGDAGFVANHGTVVRAPAIAVLVVGGAAAALWPALTPAHDEPCRAAAATRLDADFVGPGSPATADAAAAGLTGMTAGNRGVVGAVAAGAVAASGELAIDQTGELIGPALGAGGFSRDFRLVLAAFPPPAGPPSGRGGSRVGGGHARVDALAVVACLVLVAAGLPAAGPIAPRPARVVGAALLVGFAAERTALHPALGAGGGALAILGRGPGLHADVTLPAAAKTAAGLGVSTAGLRAVPPTDVAGAAGGPPSHALLEVPTPGTLRVGPPLGGNPTGQDRGRSQSGSGQHTERRTAGARSAKGPGQAVEGARVHEVPPR
jgi:hypothetical protein